MSEEQQQAANFFCKYCNTTLLGWLEADSHAEVCPSNSNSGLASGGTLLEQDGDSFDEFEGVVDELELEEAGADVVAVVGIAAVELLLLAVGH